MATKRVGVTRGALAGTVERRGRPSSPPAPVITLGDQIQMIDSICTESTSTFSKITKANQTGTAMESPKIVQFSAMEMPSATALSDAPVLVTKTEKT